MLICYSTMFCLYVNSNAQIVLLFNVSIRLVFGLDPINYVYSGRLNMS